jgi:hypothetical protein
MKKEIAFEDWMKVVNQHVINSCGLGIEDIPDYDYWSSWNHGMSPEDVAQEALEEAGWSF